MQRGGTSNQRLTRGVIYVCKVGSIQREFKLKGGLVKKCASKR